MKFVIAAGEQDVSPRADVHPPMEMCLRSKINLMPCSSTTVTRVSEACEINSQKAVNSLEELKPGQRS